MWWRWRGFLVSYKAVLSDAVFVVEGLSIMKGKVSGVPCDAGLFGRDVGVWAIERRVALGGSKQGGLVDPVPLRPSRLATIHEG